MLSLLPGKQLRGVIQGDAVPQLFIPKLISLHAAGHFPFDKLITFYDDGLNSINQVGAITLIVTLVSVNHYLPCHHTRFCQSLLALPSHSFLSIITCLVISSFLTLPGISNRARFCQSLLAFQSRSLLSTITCLAPLLLFVQSLSFVSIITRLSFATYQSQFPLFLPYITRRLRTRRPRTAINHARFCQSLLACLC
jgi:hypothetical protein